MDHVDPENIHIYQVSLIIIVILHQEFMNLKIHFADFSQNKSKKKTGSPGSVGVNRGWIRVLQVLQLSDSSAALADNDELCSYGEATLKKKKLIGKTRFGNEDHLAQKFQMLISEL